METRKCPTVVDRRPCGLPLLRLAISDGKAPAYDRYVCANGHQMYRSKTRKGGDKENSPILLRDHPLMFYRGIPNWPPVWTWVNGPEVDGPPDDKSPKGEVGVLKWASLTGIQPPDKCYLLMNHEGSSYLGCLLFEDPAFCSYLVTLLDSYCNHPIAEIGSIDLAHTL
jgi:hypothetical protein